jgi:hypothetical protein
MTKEHTGIGRNTINRCRQNPLHRLAVHHELDCGLSEGIKHGFKLQGEPAK